MKFLLWLVGIVLAGKNDDREDDLKDYVPVYQAYGSLTKAAKIAAANVALDAHQKVSFSHLHGEHERAAYSNVRTQDNCVFSLDILILQDLTGSHQGDFRETILATLSPMAATIPLTHPNSTFSLVTYRDKPINELGELDDDCFTVQKLGATSPLDLKSYLEAEQAGGGWDYPENQYGALMAVLKSPKSINWQINPLSTKLIVHITDSEPHFAGDGRDPLYPQLEAWGAGYDEDKADEYCNKKYYPSPFTVAQALEEEGAYLANIIVRPEWENGRALAAWEWFNEFVGNPAGFVQPLDDSLDNWYSELVEILEEVQLLECGAPATTESPGTIDPAGTHGGISRPTTPTGGSGTDPEENNTTPPSENTGDSNEPSTEEECDCENGAACCEQQPEVLIAILKRPKVLDVHLRGYGSDE